MYHAMFSPPMVVHFVGQQQQQQHCHHHHNSYLYTNNNNNNNQQQQNRVVPNNCYSQSSFKHPYPVELLQLMGLDMPPIRNRFYNNHHPPRERGEADWRDHGNLRGSSSPLMPPPVRLGFRPLIHNSTMKRNNWNKNSGR
jgi:hypothetical protein